MVRSQCVQIFRVSTLFLITRLACWVKNSAHDILIFPLFFHKIGFDSSCKLSLGTICMKYQCLFFGTNKKDISLSSAEFVCLYIEW